MMFLQKVPKTCRIGRISTEIMTKLIWECRGYHLALTHPGAQPSAGRCASSVEVNMGVTSNSSMMIQFLTSNK